MDTDTDTDTDTRESTVKAKFRVIFGREARLSWVLAMLGGLIGATAFTHSAGYFVTFMTGNSDRAVLGFFRNEPRLSIGAALILASFIGGVVIASLCRRHLWLEHPHGPTVLTALVLAVAAGVDFAVDGWSTNQVSFVPVLFLAFAVGALNTSFVKDGEVSVPLSYVSGTLVKMGQGIERHVSGGDATQWLSYFLLWFSFVAGGAIGGGISLLLSGCQMLVVAAITCTVISGYTHFHGDRRALLRE
ncbi:YoaK family protein [Mycobacterium sp. 050128]|uniref:YoaK family protein n=1 Tax=Mycobacterium sp. 050128 TaxID=3096112 RepID=UPI002EDAD000